jgi:hypothetical protein
LLFERDGQSLEYLGDFSIGLDQNGIAHDIYIYNWAIDDFAGEAFMVGAEVQLYDEVYTVAVIDHDWIEGKPFSRLIIRK